MNIIYKCSCLHSEVLVPVRNRFAGEDVFHWMDLIKFSVSSDHEARSPSCRSTQMEYVKIPHQEDTPVGAAQVNN